MGGQDSRAQTHVLPDSSGLGFVVTAAIGTNRHPPDLQVVGNESEKKPFYVIFDKPDGLGGSDEEAYLYNNYGNRDNIGVFYPFYKWQLNGTEFWESWKETPYNLSPFSQKVFKIAIDGVDGETREREAANTLWANTRQMIEDNY